MRKKGFTLIELLAVIIILAVIALIATPVILNVVENARKSAFQQSANGYYDAARYLYDELYLNNDRQDLMFTFEDGVQSSSNEKYKLQVKGEVPKGGIIYLTSDGQIEVSIHNNKYCATTTGTDQVTISEDVATCGYAPSECFTFSDFTLSTTIKKTLNDNGGAFEGMDGTLLQVDSFDKNNPACKGMIMIPDEYEGRKVEGIKENAFEGNTSIVSVILPKDLKIINNRVFMNTSNLKQVTMNEELRYIGASAFRYDQLTNITIPNSVVFLSAWVFSDNQLIDVKIGTGIKDLKIGVFQNNQIRNLVIPTSVININANALHNNQLPDDQAFIYKRNSDGTEDKTTIVSYGGSRRDNIIIPSSVTMIGTNAFQNNELTNIEIPNSVTTIGLGAFRNNKLKNVTIPNSVTTIDSYAFANNQLANITIPNSVKTIKNNAFGNNQLTNLTIPNSVTTIEYDAFTDNQFPNADAITIEGDATRFDSQWTSIGFPAK